MKWRLVLLTAALGVLGAGQALAQTRIITGRVTDSLTSEPVTSGQVTVAGTTLNTSIRDDGTFTVAVPNRDVAVVIRAIGFKRRDVAVPVSQNSVQAALERDFFQLEAIVVTGQATGIERRNLANAVSSVSAADLVKTAVTTVDQALVGKLAGTQIYSNSGAPGGGLQMKVRSGINSVLGNSMPLWVVDGVIINNQEIGSGLNQVTRGGSNSCSASGASCSVQDQVVNRASDINPADIENVEVLKGAAAAAIYGSKANNGVILITTKRGRAGAPQFSLTQRVGVSSISKRLGPFRQFPDSATAADFFGDIADFTTQYNDHEDILFGNKAASYETNASMSGGTETTRYFASGLVKRDGGILTNTFAEKQSIRLNIDQQIGSKLSLGFSINPVHSRRAAGFNNNDNFEVSMYMVLPVTPTWLDMTQQPDSSWPDNPYANSNPIETANVAENVENTYRMINSARLDWTPVNTATQTLKLASSGGIDWYSFIGEVFSPATSQFEPLDGFPGTAVDTRMNVNQMNVLASLVHTFKPASGAFSATTSVGASYEQRSFTRTQNFGRFLIGGIYNHADAVDRTPQHTLNKVKDAGYFAQEEILMLNDRLLLTAGIRADQSSTNSDPTKLFTYPKVAGSYRMNLVRGLVDELKIRAAYGQTGNQPLYGDKFTQLSTGRIEAIPTISLGTVLIDSLRPERQAEIETGIDATLFGARANLELTGYQRTVSDLLINRSLLPSTGFSTARFNGATFKTTGVEAALAIVPIQTPSVQWQARTTFSTDRTKITDLACRTPGDATTCIPPFNAAGSFNFGAARFIMDSSATDVWGTDTLPGCMTTWPTCPVQNLKVGNLNPDFTMGFSSDLKVKAVSFNFLISWQKGGLTSNLTRWLVDLAGTTVDYTDPCVNGCLPGETIGGQRARLFPAFNTRINVEDATYIKFREATLSLDLPRSFTSSFWSGARYVRLSVSGRNLITITDYNGVDPEVSNNGSRNIRIGFDDIAPYPPSRSFWFSIDVGF